MKSNVPTATEAVRLQELSSLSLLDTPPEKEFDDIVELAARLCDVPISLISLVAESRQWFKARTGLAISQTGRSLSFCAHALHQNDIFLVKDALQDHRFASNALVHGEPYIRFYAGAPVVSPDGYKLGTLCLIDTKPRELSWEQASVLKTLAAQVSKLIELRQKTQAIVAMRTEMDRLNKAMTALKNGTERRTRLLRAEVGNTTEFLQKKTQVLRTGKFTKKELTALSNEAANHGLRLENFRQAMAVLSRLQNGVAPWPVTPVELNVLVKEIEAELAETLKEASVNIRSFVADGLTTGRLHEPLKLICKILLQTTTGLLHKTDLVFAVNVKANHLEIRITAPYHDIRAALTELVRAPNGEADFETDNQRVELALTTEIVTALDGELSVFGHGNNGTTISVLLPLCRFATD